MDTAAIILGFTGPIGSGCTFVADGISDQFAPDFVYFRPSDIIRQHLSKEDGITEPTIDQMQTKGNVLRQKFGREYLVKNLIDSIKDDPKYTDTNTIIIDGIKNSEEIKYLRYFPYFYLFSVHADKEVRKNRCVGKIVDSDDEFYRIDKRDELENELFGQQVKECDYLSDVVVLNNNKIVEYPQSLKKDFIGKIFTKYVERIVDLRKNQLSPDYSPSSDELAMTAAYIFSKMSSCLKRKVGAVILDKRGLDGSEPDDNIITSIPFIISSGFNEVPLGSKPCMFEYGKCYRDYSQEIHAMKIKCCPNCGTAFSVTVRCFHCNKDFNKFLKVCPDCHNELSPKAFCSNTSCNVDIFKEYLPGAKGSAGKLLDVCRALHAEENAILNLVKSYDSSTENLTLYTTTQPCNLCANKIVASGIKNIVFAEPYFMEESAIILEKGGVKAKRFEGIKSSAFFKLF